MLNRNLNSMPKQKLRSYEGEDELLEGGDYKRIYATNNPNKTTDLEVASAVVFSAGPLLEEDEPLEVGEDFGGVVPDEVSNEV